MADFNKSRRELLAEFSVATGVGLTGVSGMAAATGSTIQVDPSNSNNYNTIQSAVNAADPGDHIQVAAAVYNENVTIDTSDITITGVPGDYSPGVGSNAPTLDGQQAVGQGFRFKDNISGVTIEGFKIRNYGKDYDNRGHGIRAQKPTQDITVRDNYIYDCGWSGIQVFSKGEFLHRNWDINRNKFGGSAFADIELTNSSASSIRNNKIVDVSEVPNAGEDYSESDPLSYHGILIKANSEGPDQRVHSIEIRNNDIDNISGGIGLSLGCLIMNTDDPTTLRLEDITVEQNSISGDDALAGVLFNSRPSGPGINEINDVSIRNTNVTGFTYGVALNDRRNQGLEAVSLSESKISDHRYGVYFLPDTPADDISLTSSDLTNCEEYAVAHYGTGTLDATCNYWGHPTGPQPENSDNAKGERITGDVDYDPLLPQSYETVSSNSCHERGQSGREN